MCDVRQARQEGGQLIGAGRENIRRSKWDDRMVGVGQQILYSEDVFCVENR